MEEGHGIILEKLEGLKNLNMEQHGAIIEKVEAVRVQTTKTNGRVSKLEGWRNKLIGAWVITTIILLPTLLILLSHYLKS